MELFYWNHGRLHLNLGDDEGVMRRPTLRFLLPGFAGATLLLASAVQAQSTRDEIEKRLTSQPLILRGLWAEDKLEFDGAGQPKKDYRTTSVTVCGMQVQNVAVSGKVLRLNGIRMALEWHPTPDSRSRRLTMDEVPVLKSKDPGSVEKMSVEIKGAENFGPAIDAIFATNLADLVPVLPDYWKVFAERQGEDIVSKRDPVIPDVKSGAVPRPWHVGGSVQPPKLIYQVDPVFSEEARRAKISGNTQIYMIVGADGVPQKVLIARPAGHGLDEKAVEAARQYRFRPATRDGEPVPVDLYIDVNFQVF